MDAAEHALPDDLVFVDLETTGGNAAFHRITEVGIVRMQQGRVVEEWSSLVNPGCRIPSAIVDFTGITNEMVQAAPAFADLAATVLGKLRPTPSIPGQGAPLFVAHNARFDYAFLRTEFRRVSVRFAAPVLCTVKLSRRLYPQHHRHSLDAIMARHGLLCSARHRALGDARVLADFWAILRRDISAADLGAAAQAVLGAARLPAHLPPDLADDLPEGPGVYRFFGADDALLYIGMSRALRTRVLGHFAAEHTDAKEQKKARQTRRVDWFETPGELGAQLREAAWIKAQRPLFNKRLKHSAGAATLRLRPQRDEVDVTAIETLSSVELGSCFGVFQGSKDARKALADIARAHLLCLKVLGAESGAGSCFAHQVGRCKGACVGKEPLALHRLRVQMALVALKLKPWPYPGRIALQEGNAADGLVEFHVLEPWAYLGSARSQEELVELAAARAPRAFDADVYRILNRYIAKHPGAPVRTLAPESPIVDAS